MNYKIKAIKNDGENRKLDNSKAVFYIVVLKFFSEVFYIYPTIIMNLISK